MITADSEGDFGLSDVVLAMIHLIKVRQRIQLQTFWSGEDTEVGFGTRKDDWVPGGNMAKEQESSTAPLKGPDGNEAVPEGATVLQEVVQMTGLPEEYLNTEISEFLGTNGSVNELTLEQLRAALLNYLETINDEINQSQTPN